MKNLSFTTLMVLLASTVYGQVCDGQKPAGNFVCASGNWVPNDHPMAQFAPAPRVAQPGTSVQPPTEDEYVTVEAYAGSGIFDQVLVRTKDPKRWFKSGKIYRMPYEFFAKVGDVEFGCIPDGIVRGRDVCDFLQKLTIIHSTGEPEVGAVLKVRLFAPTRFWREATPEEIRDHGLESYVENRFSM